MKLELQKELQKKARKAHKEFNKRSTVAMTMGTGKSKVAIEEIEELLEENPNAKILFAAPYKLYLSNFQLEVQKFNSLLLDKIEYVCNKSLPNLKGVYDIVIVDEAHKQKDLYFEFIKKQLALNNNIQILCLTGTPKKTFDFRNVYGIVPISFEEGLQAAIDKKIVNDYTIIKVYHKLDSENNMLVTTPKVKFYTSEVASYSRLIKRIEKLKKEELEAEIDTVVDNSEALKINDRYLKLLFNKLQSKRVAALNLLKDLTGKTLIYAGSKQESEKFGLPFYHSGMKTLEKKEVFSKFLSGEIQVLVNVDAVKESVSVPDLKNVIILHCGRSTTELKQIIGRVQRLIPDEEIGNIYILLAEDTVEEEWFEKAANFVNSDNIISYVRSAGSS